MAKLVPQILPRRYINRADLKKLLGRLFGQDYEIEDCDDAWAIDVPRKLTDAEIESITKP